MNDLYCWYYSVDKLPEGVPIDLQTFVMEVFNPKKPLPDFDYNWRRYNFYSMPFPPEREELRLPKNLSLTFRKVKKPAFDFLNFEREYKVVSSAFLEILKEYGINENYELAEVNLLSKKGEILNKSKYYMMRFAKFDDDLFDFNEETKVQVGGFPFNSSFLYPDMKLKTATDKEVFVLNNFCYNSCFVFTEKVKNRIEEELYKPEIYSLKEFPEAYISLIRMGS